VNYPSKGEKMIQKLTFS